MLFCWWKQFRLISVRLVLTWSYTVKRDGRLSILFGVSYISMHTSDDNQALTWSCQHTGCNKLWNFSDMALDLPIDTNILFGDQSQPMQAWPSLTYNVGCRLMLSHHPRPVHFCRKSFSETLFSTAATASGLRPSNFRLTIPIFFCGGIFLIIAYLVKIRNINHLWERIVTNVVPAVPDILVRNCEARAW